MYHLYQSMALCALVVRTSNYHQQVIVWRHHNAIDHNGCYMGCIGLGRIVATKNPKFKVGDVVNCMPGWQEYEVADGKAVTVLPSLAGVDEKVWLGPLGMTGMTAYFGLLEIGKPKQGETVLVSGAAGATGSIVGQIAKEKGCRVVGLAGTQKKCDWLVKECGFDVAINYRYVIIMMTSCACAIGAYWMLCHIYIVIQLHLVLVV